jgi:hypothetical protein
MCENLPYAFLSAEGLDYVIENIARTADQMEQSLEPGADVT